MIMGAERSPFAVHRSTFDMRARSFLSRAFWISFILEKYESFGSSIFVSGLYLSNTINAER
jgi:hypothetical protein